jgi:hypothetical protein
MKDFKIGFNSFSVDEEKIYINDIKNYDEINPWSN